MNDAEILYDILRVTVKIGKSPTAEEYKEIGEYGVTTIQRRFGSWNEAKGLVGVRPASPSSYGKRGLYRRELERAECAACGESAACALQFHHLNGESKSASVSEMLAGGWSEGEMKAEMEKCVVVCANCHNKIHSLGHGLTEEALV